VKHRLLLAVATLTAVNVVHAQMMPAPQARPSQARPMIAPCTISRILADSARDEALSVLRSDMQLAQELRRDLGVGIDAFAPVEIIRQRSACVRAASAFGREIGPSARFVLLKLGPVYYARDPDQKIATGVVLDSAYNVVLRLGRAIP